MIANFFVTVETKEGQETTLFFKSERNLPSLWFAARTYYNLHIARDYKV